MLVLAVDTGKGTQDILLWETSEPFSNATQLVVPSPTKQMENILRTVPQKNILLRGRGIMGGEPWNKLLYERALTNKVIAGETAAMSLKYSKDSVKSKGVEIVPDTRLEELVAENPDFLVLETQDINWSSLAQALKSLTGVDIYQSVDLVLLCAQDHGLPKQGTTIKESRFDLYLDGLAKRRELEQLLIGGEGLNNWPRLQSNWNRARVLFPEQTQIFVMDSSPAVVLGGQVALSKPDYSQKARWIANFGNGHTIFALFDLSGEVHAVVETHTGLFRKDAGASTRFYNLLQSVNFTHDDILAGNGHGAVIFSKPDNLEKTIFTVGPQRDLVSHQEELYPPINPWGNMMMAGPIGMYSAYQTRFGQ